MPIFKPCPRCQAPLAIPQPPPGQIHCSKCGATIKNRASKKAEAVKLDPPPSTAPIPQASIAPPLAASPSSAKSGRGLLVGIIAGVLLLGMAPIVGLGVAWYFSGAETQRPPDPITLPEDANMPELTEHEKNVASAIEKGAAYLEKQILEGKVPADNEHNSDLQTGAAALMGLALLEAGKKPEDAAIKKALNTVRQKKTDLAYVYALSTSLFFLKRLNEAGALDESDQQLTRTFALRLIAGQCLWGQWSYDNQPLTPEAENQLLKDLRAGQFIPSNGARWRSATTGVHGAHGSNSMTQFAMLALWGARSRDVPVRAPLMRAALQFHGTQKPDGAWEYHHSNANRNDSNTCAGLLGLAIEDALRKEKEFADDAAPLPPPNPNIAKIREKAFEKLGKAIGRQKTDPHNGGEEEKANTLFRSAAWGDIYFLWCVERVAVIYDEKLLGGKDWYQWGSQVLLDAQKRDGSWADRYDPAIDTSFAILFLKRANLAKDLTVRTRRWRDRDRDPALEPPPADKASPQKKSLFN